MEVISILQTRDNELNDVEKVPIMKNWLGSEGLQFINSQILKEACKMAEGLKYAQWEIQATTQQTNIIIMML